MIFKADLGVKITPRIQVAACSFKYRVYYIYMRIVCIHALNSQTKLHQTRHLKKTRARGYNSEHSFKKLLKIKFLAILVAKEALYKRNK